MKKLLLLSTFIVLTNSAMAAIDETALAYSAVKLDESIISESNFENDVV